MKPGSGPPSPKKMVVPLLLIALVGAGSLAWGLTSSPKKRPCLTTYGGLSGGVGGLILGPGGDIWGSEGMNDKIARLDPRTHRVTEYPTPPDTGPHALTVGPDGDLWFSGITGQIGRLDPDSGEITLLEGVAKDGQPHGLVWAVDGNLYWAEQLTGRIGRYDPRTQEVTSNTYDLPANNGIHSGYELPDGSIWWSLQGADKLARFDPRTERIEEFITFPPQSGPHEVEYARSTNTLYVTLAFSNRIARHDLGTGETTYLKSPFAAIPPAGQIAALSTKPAAQVTDIALDRDEKHLWASTFFGGSLLRYNLDTDKVTTVICGMKPPGATLVMAPDPDGRLWVGQPVPAAISRIDP